MQGKRTANCRRASRRASRIRHGYLQRGRLPRCTGLPGRRQNLRYPGGDPRADTIENVFVDGVDSGRRVNVSASLDARPVSYNRLGPPRQSPLRAAHRGPTIEIRTGRSMVRNSAAGGLSWALASEPTGPLKIGIAIPNQFAGAPAMACTTVALQATRASECRYRKGFPTALGRAGMVKP